MSEKKKETEGTDGDNEESINLLDRRIFAVVQMLYEAEARGEILGIPAAAAVLCHLADMSRARDETIVTMVTEMLPACRAAQEQLALGHAIAQMEARGGKMDA